MLFSSFHSSLIIYDKSVFTSLRSRRPRQTNGFLRCHHSVIAYRHRSADGIGTSPTLPHDCQSNHNSVPSVRRALHLRPDQKSQPPHRTHHSLVFERGIIAFHPYQYSFGLVIPQTYNQVLLVLGLAKQLRKAVSPTTCFKLKPTPVIINKLAISFFVESYNFHNLKVLLMLIRVTIQSASHPYPRYARGRLRRHRAGSIA